MQEARGASLSVGRQGSAAPGGSRPPPGWGVAEVLIAVFVAAAALLGALSGALVAEGLLHGALLAAAGAVVYAAFAAVVAALVGIGVELVRRGVPAQDDVAGVGLESTPVDEDAALWAVAAGAAYAAGLVFLGYAGLLPALGLALVARRGSARGSWNRGFSTAIWLASALTIAVAMLAAVSGRGEPFWQRLWVW